MVPTLITERLVLRPRDLADVEASVAMDSDIEVRRYLTPAFRDDFDAEAYRAALAERVAIDAGPGLGWWISRPRAEPNRFLGMILLIPVALAGPDIEIGWRMPRAAWGAGFATEAARHVAKHAFETLALDRIVALIDPGNARSLRVAAKLGCVADGRRQAYGTAFDQYALTAEAWRRAGGDAD